MKKISLFIALFQFLASPWAAADYTVITQPDQIQEFQRNGVGAIYNFKLNNGNYGRLRVTDLHFDSKQNALVVMVEKADSVEILDLAGQFQPSSVPTPDSETGVNSRTENPLPGNEVAPTPPSTSDPHADDSDTPPQPASSDSHPDGRGGVSWSAGVGSAALQGAKVALVLGSGLNEKINEAYRQIAEQNSRRDKSLNEIQASKEKLQEQIDGIMGHTEPHDQLLSTFAPPRFTKSQEEMAADLRRAGEQKPYPWQSLDPVFRARAETVSQKLYSRPPQNSIEQTYRDIGEQALKVGDEASAQGAKDDAEAALDLAETAADIFVGLDPYTGTVRSLYESVTGKNMITDKELSDGERALAVVGLITGGLAAKGPRILKALEKVGERIAPRLRATFNGAKKLFQAFGHGERATIDSQRVLRKINLSSDLDKSWGLTNTHLHKHFFGNSRFSLKTIDPGGNVEKWLNEIGDLASRPVTNVTNNGALQVIGEFQRADSSGTYKIGLRLWERADGSFDLITILTDQKRF